MKLTEEQKRMRKDMDEISKKLDKEEGRDKIKFVKIKGEPSWKTFVIFDHTKVSQGGWSDGKWMTAKYMRERVKNWVRQSYKTGEEQPNYDEWIEHQCGGCRWFAALDSDYGLCFNIHSPNEGRITFEHGGCKSHSYLEEKH